MELARVSGGEDVAERGVSDVVDGCVVVGAVERVEGFGTQFRARSGRRKVL